MGDKVAVSIAAGMCPSCGRSVKHYEFPFGSFAPEIAASMKERGIDPYSNHKASCPYRTFSWDRLCREEIQRAD